MVLNNYGSIILHIYSYPCTVHWRKRLQDRTIVPDARKIRRVPRMAAVRRSRVRVSARHPNWLLLFWADSIEEILNPKKKIKHFCVLIEWFHYMLFALDVHNVHIVHSFTTPCFKNKAMIKRKERMKRLIHFYTALLRGSIHINLLWIKSYFLKESIFGILLGWFHCTLVLNINESFVLARPLVLNVNILGHICTNHFLKRTEARDFTFLHE